jgi:hypothetical protein
MNSTQKVYYKYGYDDALRGDDYDPPEDVQLKKAYAEGWHSGNIKRSKGSHDESSAFKGSDQGLVETEQDKRNSEYRLKWAGKGKSKTRKHSKKSRKTRRTKVLRRKL